MSADFVEEVAEALYRLPFVRAIALGGSRATGRAGSASDWDLALYYDEGFDPSTIDRLRYRGEVFPLGGWGGGLFDGGAYLDVDGQKVDVHYRRFSHVEERAAEALRGEFWVERLPFYLAGIPSYVLVAEVAVQQALRGTPPVAPAYPDELRASASRFWRAAATLSLGYAEAVAETALVTGNLARALVEGAHSSLAARGIWVTNEKRMLGDAGLSAVPLDADSVRSALEREWDG